MSTEAWRLRKPLWFGVLTHTYAYQRDECVGTDVTTQRGGVSSEMFLPAFSSQMISTLRI
jgi:hypothetical protein